MRRKKAEPKPKEDTRIIHVGSKDPTVPAKYGPAEVAAIQSLLGNEQGKRALDWIVHGACDAYGMSFRGDPYDTAFAEGKRFVGNQVIKLMKIRLDTVEAAVKRRSDEK